MRASDSRHTLVLDGHGGHRRYDVEYDVVVGSGPQMCAVSSGVSTTVSQGDMKNLRVATEQGGFEHGKQLVIGVRWDNIPRPNVQNAENNTRAMSKRR